MGEYILLPPPTEPLGELPALNLDFTFDCTGPLLPSDLAPEEPKLLCKGFRLGGVYCPAAPLPLDTLDLAAGDALSLYGDT